MNPYKLLSPDFPLGKVLVLGRALVQLPLFLLRRPSRRSVRIARLIWQMKPRYTMVSTPRLVNLYDRVAEANVLGIPGDIVECGVWNGGSAALMAAACKDTEGNAPTRRLWLFDSFQGLPRPGERDGRQERANFFNGWSRGHVEQVRRAFRKVNVSLDDVTIVPGWFDETLRKAEIESIAVLHVDADWYDSVKSVLESLYDKVVPGGCVILDDYERFQGCTVALDDFLKERHIDGVELKKVETAGAYFRKPA